MTHSQHNSTIFRAAIWSADSAALMAVRNTVFVKEQGVPVELEQDGLDPSCAHVLALEDGTPVGTGRITEKGHIGRVAVLASHRGRGIGTCLLYTSPSPRD